MKEKRFEPPYSGQHCSSKAKFFEYKFHTLRAHENFQKKKKCVSIDSKWSEMHRNAKKKFVPL